MHKSRTCINEIISCAWPPRSKGGFSLLVRMADMKNIILNHIDVLRYEEELYDACSENAICEKPENL